MPWLLTDIYGALPAFMLVLARVAGLMIAAPFFSGNVVPNRVKGLLAGAISLAVFPLLAPQVKMPVTLGMAAAGMMGEIAIGLLIGLGVSLMFVGAQIGIQLASQQAGMALGRIFNPMLESSVPIVAQLYYWVSVMIFLAVNGHHALVRALLDSFETIPPLGFRVTEGVVTLLADLLTVSFALAIRVGGPTILALLLGFMTLGFISRTMPQLNILTVGFPLKIGIALIMMALTIMSLESVLLDTMTIALDGVRSGLGLDGALVSR